jgi:transposase-like protein
VADGSACQEMSRFSENLGGKREAAILALLTARSVDDAARTVGIAPRTLYRWLQEPAFDAEYRKAKRSSFGQALARLQQGSGAAAATMLKIMVDPTVSASTRLRAADCVLNHSKNAIEVEDIEARLAELERAAKLDTGRRTPGR